MLLTELEMAESPKAEFEAGATLIEENTPGAKVYVLIEGAVRVSVNGRVICDITDPGAIFGEMSNLLGQNHVAAVTVIEASAFYVLDDFMTFVRRHPEVAIEFMKVLAERVAEANSRLTEDDKPQRVWWRFWSSQQAK